ncbi:MAG TPA: hypothetical protein VGS62_09840 [Streptosporangiaceae bacterium]|nr:hypothetical protein [Streptosporangiaceae bacterium]
MAVGWPKFKDMNWLRLLEGPGNLVVLPMAPTMANITYKSERYFRMPDTRSTLRDGEDGDGFTEYGGAYLWDGYWTTLLRAHAEAATGLR